jgi:NADH-quinone oxidoreductase subunit F
MVTAINQVLPASDVPSLAAHIEGGGLEGLAWAHAHPSDDILDLIAEAGIRGRGGAGFPMAVKWRGVRDALMPGDDAFVVINAAEGEPGTFKDRTLLGRNPYLVLEGALIAARVLGAHRIVLATKQKFTSTVARVRGAMEEISGIPEAEGIAFELVEGPDRYLFGEETGLLEVIEGGEPTPRHLPPYQYGLFTAQPNVGWSASPDESSTGPAVESHNPALVNNVESFAHVAAVCRHGAEWYRLMGTPESPGPTIVTITGDVERPFVGEVPLGVPLGDVIRDLAGGVAGGRKVKAILSGISNGALTAEHLETPLTYEALREAGGGLGSAGFIVFDETRNMVDVAARYARFLHVESCGQCNPCKAGTREITIGFEALVEGDVSQGPLDRIARATQTVTDGSRCFLPTQAMIVSSSILRSFPEDVAERSSGIGGRHDVPLPLITGIDGSEVRIDPNADYYRPDWTRAEQPVRIRPASR